MYSVIPIKAFSMSYLIKSNGFNILVDTGLPSSKKKIIKALGGEKLDLIILTHGHYDHIANTAYLVAKYKCKVLMNKVDHKYINNPLPLGTKANDIGGVLINISSKLQGPFLKLDKFDVDLDYDADLGIYFDNYEIVKLPGHTEGSIGLLLNNKDFFTGDAVMNMFYPTISRVYVNKDDMLDSAKYILNSDCILYTGHGKCLSKDLYPVMK